MTTAASGPSPSGGAEAGPVGPCWTRVYLSSALPPDLVTWAEAAAELADGPHPMSERDLRRRFKASGRRRTWRVQGRRAEMVAMSDVWMFHRDLHRGWLREEGGTRGGSSAG
ncbi:hypothetical protein [Kitasatospora sp. NPDC090091]|uniref:hypothetical protein n=1 Tax=Kitasatospora sp. NPDC090091 TaxID=3364081 RepID=UPI00382EC97F